MWQANAAGRYQHTGHEYDAPFDPNFRGNGVVYADQDGGFKVMTIAPGHYRVQGAGAMRPNHFHFVLSGPGFANRVFTEMYFPGDPLMILDKNESAASAVPKQQVCHFDSALITFESVLSYRFDIVLGGSDATPLADVSRHDWIA
jgi:protocatechuate 3,4-dioxygenase beta subunit